MHRVVSPAAMMLVLLTVVAMPARAGSLRANDVAQLLVTSRGNAQLRLRGISQNSNPVVTSQNPRSTSGNNTTGAATGNSPASTNPESLNVITQDPSVPNVETIELGDVTGTVCDCGEIAVPIIPGGGFPLYPLLALGAIPLAFLNFGGDEEVEVFPPPTPVTPVTPVTPTPPTAPIPEPATLFLLGSGLVALGAGARRRRRAQAGKSHTHNDEIVGEV